MTDDPVQRLSAALRAQAGHRQTPPAGHRATHVRAGLPAWAVLALAVLLGAMAGALAGAISAW